MDCYLGPSQRRRSPARRPGLRQRAAAAASTNRSTRVQRYGGDSSPISPSRGGDSSSRFLSHAPAFAPHRLDPRRIEPVVRRPEALILAPAAVLNGSPPLRNTCRTLTDFQTVARAVRVRSFLRLTPR